MAYDEEPPEDYDTPPGDNVRTLPQAHLLAERALLSLVLTEPATYDVIATQIGPNDFDEPRHQTIWDAMAAVAQRQGHPPETSLVLEELQQTKQITKVAALLPALVTEQRSVAMAGEYARQVREAAEKRFLTTDLRQALHDVTTTGPGALSTTAMHVMDRLDAILRNQWSIDTGLHTDLTWLLTGQAPQVAPPTYVRRVDGHAIFYPARVNGIFGDPETAKSWIAQIAIVEALTAGQRAALVDVDHNGAALTTERLLLLGATAAQLADPDLFRYCEPADGPELLATVGQLAAWKPAVAVLDSIGEIMPMLGIKSVDNDELSTGLRQTATVLANAGACVITVDHLPKSPDARTTGFAIGGTAKKRAMDGSYVHAEAKVAPAPGQIGRIILRIEKDRPGRLRSTCTGKYIGTFTLDSTNTGVITTSIDRETTPTNDAGQLRPTNRMEAISRYVEEHDQATYRDIKAAVTGGDKTLRAAIDRLREEGYLSILPGQRGSTIHHSIGMYREADDDQI